VLTSFIVLLLVLVAGVFPGSGPLSWALQPATTLDRSGAGQPRFRRNDILAALRFDKDDDNSIIMDSLRVLGLVRRRIERPTVGRRAYVRVWERVRALIVLAAIIISIGILLAASIGILVLAAGFLLEQAIA